MAPDKLNAVDALVARQQQVIEDYKKVCINLKSFIENKAKLNVNDFDVVKLPVFIKAEINKFETKSDTYKVLNLVNQYFILRLCRRYDIGYFSLLYKDNKDVQKIRFDKYTINKLKNNPEKFGYLQTYKEQIIDLVHPLEFKIITRKDVLENTRLVNHFWNKKSENKMDKQIQEFQKYQNEQKQIVINKFEKYFDVDDTELVQKAFKQLGLCVY